nr:hypothetical protein [Tanacetum cinerariifolium]
MGEVRIAKDLPLKVIYGIANKVLVWLKFGRLGRNSPPTFISVPLVRYSTSGVIQVNSIPSGFMRMSLTPDHSKHEDPSMKRVYGSRISSSIGIHASGASSSGLSAIKSIKIWMQMDVLGL